MDRRTTLKWMMTAAAAVPAWHLVAQNSATGDGGHGGYGGTGGYGTDPDLVKRYRSGDLWPLTLSAEQRATAGALCALIIPADARSPSAAQLGVHLFIDEWISAPYPRHQKDREQILEGLAWLDTDATKRFNKKFAALTETQQRAICDPVSWPEKARPELLTQATFFSRFRNLTADGFYTTPEGMKDLGFVGNKPSATFDGPPLTALKKAGLA